MRTHIRTNEYWDSEEKRIVIINDSPDKPLEAEKIQADELADTPVPIGLESQTVAQLKEMAASHDIKLKSGLTKAAIIDVLSDSL